MTKLSEYLKHSPARATSEELRQFQIALAEQGTPNITINATLSGCNSYFCKTLYRADIVYKLSTAPTPRKLPQVPSLEEIKRLIVAANNLKYRIAL
ncbi:MAG: integrase/recombinase XerD [Paraglaciecola sp.]